MSARPAPSAHAGAHLLSQRLREVARVLLPGVPPPHADPASDAGRILDDLIGRHLADPDESSVWLLAVGLTGAYPTRDEVRALIRTLDLATNPSVAALEILEAAHVMIRDRGGLDARELEIVTGRVLLDADFSARYDYNSGIQRVAREVCSRWVPSRSALAVVWTDDRTGLRRPTAREQHRLVRWGYPWDGGEVEPAPSVSTRLVVPWDCTVVLLEVPPDPALEALASLAESSDNRVVALGYDAIPVTSIDMRPLDDATVFARYLSALKRADRVLAISVSAATEFRGFSQALAAQGLVGPQVTEVLLASQSAASDTPVPQERPAGPLRALVIGSHEVHKNHLAVLHAAELLWRSGITFELQFIGGRGTDGDRFAAQVAALKARGRTLTDLGRVDDDEMARTSAAADFTVFPSLHEGYGLPVAESLASGTPVITSDFGSMREIAEHGGCLLVDPRDDLAIESAMRRLLTEPDLLRELTSAAVARPVRPWDVYADELWAAATAISTSDEGGLR